MHTILSRCAPVAAICVLAMVLTGCTNYKSLTFRVIDIETGEPISDATIVVEQGAGDPPFSAKTHSDTTGGDGLAKVIAADKPFVAVDVQARGYVGERLRILRPHGDASVEPASIGTVAQLNDVEYELRLLRGPQTIVTLLVPEGYTGAIKLEYGATDEWEPGGRRFVLAVEDGRVQLPATPALDVAHRFEARWATGGRIPGPLGSWERTEPMRSQVRLRGPVDGVRVPVYVIGDLDDFQRVMREMYPRP